MINPDTLIQGDCLKIMPDIADDSVDAIIADLPFNQTCCNWDHPIPLDELWTQYKRVIKKNGAIVLFGKQPFSSQLIASNPKWFKYEWIWEKTRPCGFFNVQHKPMNRHESILIFSEGATANCSKRNMPYYPQGTNACDKVRRGDSNINKSSNHNFNRPSHKRKHRQTTTNYPHSILPFQSVSKPEHPTEKPVALLEYLVKTYTTEGETVLDNVAGSGTTLLAARNTNRRYIGIEMAEEYFLSAKKRLEKEG